MAEKSLKPGDRVEWGTAQGKTTGKVKKKVTSPMKIKSHEVKASKENPEYLVESEKSGKPAAHKPSELRKVASKSGSEKAAPAKKGTTEKKGATAKVKPAGKASSAAKTKPAGEKASSVKASAKKPAAKATTAKTPTAKKSSSTKSTAKPAAKKAAPKKAAAKSTKR